MDNTEKLEEALSNLEMAVNSMDQALGILAKIKGQKPNVTQLQKIRDELCESLGEMEVACG